MLVHQLLHEAAARDREAVALIEPKRSVSYAELDGMANCFANLLLCAGVKRGDRVVLALENSVELVAAYFGAMRAGAAAVPLPPGPRSDRFIGAVSDCTPRVAIIEERLARELAPTFDNIPSIFIRRGAAVTRGAQAPALGHDLGKGLETAGSNEPSVPVTAAELAAIIYTSGSTGTPRGVMLTHGNIVANTRSIVEYQGLTASDRVMCILPFHYVFGLSLLHTHVAVGGSVVIDNRFVFPNVVLEAMQRRRVTGLAGVPSTFALLLHRSNLAGMKFPDLRYVAQAGGGMPPARVREWLERGPQVPFYVMYGATEASARLTYLPPADLRRKLGSIGRPIPGVEISVMADGDRIAGFGEVGELVARGENISPGYWNNLEETREKFGALGYRTGDLGYVDEDGFLFLVGRRHDMIKVGGRRVGAREIEDVLHDHPQVFEAAVIGVAHEILGEAPVAFVAAREKDAVVHAESLAAFCHSKLPHYKVPVRFIFCQEIPKLPGVGKIDKGALRELAGAEAATVAARR